MHEYDNSGKSIYYYYGVDGLYGFRIGETDYFYKKNLQGDITDIYHEDGTKYASYVYDAWGNCTITLDTNGIGTLNSFRYRGYYYDSETNLYYLKSRYYDPAVGRFLNQDDPSFIGSNNSIVGYNLFSYCDNNPVKYIDPTGNYSWKDMFWTGVKIFAVGVILLSAIPTGGGSLVLAGVGISATAATVAAGAITATGVAVAGSSLVFMASDGTPGNNQAQNKQFNDAMKSLKIKDKELIRRIHDAISGQGLTYHEIIEVAKMFIGH